MRGWLLYMAVLICAVLGTLYYHDAPHLTHSPFANLITPPQAAPPQEQPPRMGAQMQPAPMALFQSGTCYLTVSVEVSNKYGKVTYARGTPLIYLGPRDGRLAVEHGIDRFTVTPPMLATSLAAAMGQLQPAAVAREGSTLGNTLTQGDMGRANSVADLSAAESPPDLVTGPLKSSDYARYLLIASGPEGRGSGCLVNYQGKTRVVTNAHVISMLTNSQFQRLDSQQVPTGPFSFADGADLAAADQSSTNDGLPIMTDLEKEVNIGDEVVVLGNSLGSDVVTEINGHVTGIGPELVEVDAKFVEGNSGSPIIHVKTGKLIGIATFAQRRKLDSLSKDSQFSTEWRRFGYRLDTVKTWEHPTAFQIAQQTKKTQAVRKLTESLFVLGQDIQGGHINAWKYQSPDNPLRDIVNEFVSNPTGLGLSGTDKNDSRMRFERAIVFATEGDISGLRQEDFTWFHWHELQQDIEARTFLKKAFEQMLASDEAAHNPLN